MTDEEKATSVERVLSRAPRAVFWVAPGSAGKGSQVIRYDSETLSDKFYATLLDVFRDGWRIVSISSSSINVTDMILCEKEEINL